MTNLVPSRNSVIQFKLGNRTYDAVHSPSCSVCTHPARFIIEERILENYSIPAIVRFVSENGKRTIDGTEVEWPEVTDAMIRNHKKMGHCTLDGEMVSQFAEERARELGKKIEEGYAPLVDHVVVSKLILKRGHEALVKGEIAPDVKDTIAAAKMLSDLEANSESGASLEQWQEFMEIYFTAVKSVVTEEQWSKIGNAIARHPVMRSIQKNNTYDAEVVEN